MDHSPQPMTPLPVIRYRADDPVALEVCDACADNITLWLQSHGWQDGVPGGDQLLARIIIALSEFINEDGGVEGRAADITLRLNQVISGVIAAR